MSDEITPTEFSYKRVMLKISGEALMGDQGFGSIHQRLSELQKKSSVSTI